MAQSGYGSQPSAPPLLGPSAEDDMAPPTYEEATQAPSGGSFGNLSSPLETDRASGGVLWHPSVTGGTADLRADIEAGTASRGPLDTAGTESPSPATGGTGDEPPSYQSLFGQLKETKESSSGVIDFISKLFVMPLQCLLGLVLLVVVVGLLFGLPVTLLTVGSLYMFECPVEPGIPIWMVVGGVVIIVYTFWVGCTGESASGYQAGFGAVFYLAWYIAGCVIIYRTWQPAFEPSYEEDTSYCDYTLMMTAFITINLLSVVTSVACCSCSL